MVTPYMHVCGSNIVYWCDSLGIT